MRRRYPLLVAVAALLLATPLLLAATSGSAQRLTALTCGLTVRTSVVLANDLGPCSGDGLDVGANGITINLNGHTITGGGSHWGIFDHSYTSVTVENGTLTGFASGVRFENGASGGRLQGLRLTSNASCGADVDGSDHVVLSGNYAVSNPHEGFCVSNGSADQVAGNWVEANGIDGIDVIDDNAVVVSQNRMLNDSENGLYVGENTTGQVSGNVVNGNGFDGINSVDAALGLTLNGNRASFNGRLGINAAPGQKDGGGNVVQDNATAAQCKNVVCAEVSS
jgi:hypothetical protein